jgi:uncharacterized protein
MTEKKSGKIIWSDITVENATQLREFYSEVVGWNHESVKQSDYEDYNMLNDEGEIVAGICHRKGGNIKLPPQWLMYITVDDLSKSLDSCVSLGGKIIDGPKNFGSQQFAVIQDPAGAYVALFEE